MKYAVEVSTADPIGPLQTGLVGARPLSVTGKLDVAGVTPRFDGASATSFSLDDLVGDDFIQRLSRTQNSL